MSFNPHQYSAEHHDGARELKGRLPTNKLQGGMKTKHQQEMVLANQVTQHNIDKQKESTHKILSSTPSAKSPKKSNSKTTSKSTVKKVVTKTKIKTMKAKTSSKTVLKGVGKLPKLSPKKASAKVSSKPSSKKLS